MSCDFWSNIRSLFFSVKGDESDSIVDDKNTFQKTGILPISTSFTKEETDFLLRVHSRLTEEKTSQHQDPSPENETFLYRLAWFAIEEHCQDEHTSFPATGLDDDFMEAENPEEAIKRALANAKRHEAYNEWRKSFLNQVLCLQKHQWLPSAFGKELQSSLAQGSKTGSGEQSKDNFFGVLKVWLGRDSKSALLNALFSSSKPPDEPTIRTGEASAYHLIYNCYISAAIAFTLRNCLEYDNKCTEEDDTCICKQKSMEPLVRSLLDFKRKHFHSNIQPLDSLDISQGTATRLVDRAVFEKWHNKYFPSMLSSLSSVTEHLVFPAFSDEEKPSSLLPELEEGKINDSLLFTNSFSPWVFVISSMLKTEVATKWHRLYSTNFDGTSFSRIEQAIIGYNGPTLFLVNGFTDDGSDKTATFGAFASTTWKNTNGEFFGDENCFLFQLQPHLTVMRATPESKHGGKYQYFNSSPTSNKKLAGIGFGGTARQPRLFIPSTLDKCHAGSLDSSYETGELVSPSSLVSRATSSVDICSIEVWGLGGDNSLESRNRHRTIVNAHLEKARQVDKAAFLNDFRSGLIESKMFAFHEQMRDRDGGCILEYDDNDTLA